MLPPSSLRLLYHSFIQPYIQYTLPAWGGCSAQNKKRIINIQKRAIRTITKSYHTAHTEPRMKQLGLLKFDDLYYMQSALLAHDCFYGNAPINIRNCLSYSSSNNHNLRSQIANPLDAKVPNLKTRAGTNSFSSKGPTFWNKTPTELRAVSQKEQFKRAIKKSILKNYDLKTSCTNPLCKDQRHHLCLG